MPNAAICISGHMRDCGYCHKFFCQNLICANPNFDFDVYIHTWEFTNHDTVTDRTNGKHTGLYKPRAAVIERTKNWDTSKYIKLPHVIAHPFTGGEHIFGCFYKIKKCHNMMLSSGVRDYDMVIRIRPDFIFDTPLNLSDLLPRIKDTMFFPKAGCMLPINPEEQSAVYIPVIRQSNMMPECNYGALNDMFAVSSVENMSHYAATYDNIDYLTDKHKVWMPEGILYQQMRERRDIKLGMLELPWRLRRTNNLDQYFI